MNDLTTLLKKQLGFYLDIRGFFNDKKSRKKFFALVFSVLLMLFYIVLIQKSLFKYYDLYLELGKAKNLLITGISAYLSAVLIFTTTSNIAKIYYSNETKILLRLPIRHSSIFISKILSASFSALAFSILLVFPMIYKIGVFYNKSVLFYLVALISTYLVTVILISIEMLIIVWIMYYVNRSRVLKQALKYISTIIFFLFVVGLQLFIQLTISGSSAENIMENIDNTQGIFTKAYPQLNLFANALLGESFGIRALNFFLLLAATLVLLYIVVKLGYKRMASGVLNENVVSKKHKKTKFTEYKTQASYMAICKKDLKNIFSNATYFINKFSMGIIFPLFFGGGILVGGKEDGLDIQTSLELVRGFLEEHYTLALAIALLGFIPIALFFGSSSELTSSTFSREGKNMWMMKVYPIKTKDQVLGRILASTIFLVLANIPVILIISYVAKFDLLIMLSLFLASFVIAAFLSSLNLIFGILFAYTEWDNPAQAIKGSRSLIPLLINVGMMVGLVYTLFKILGSGIEDLSDNLIYLPLIIYAGMAILTGVLYVIDKKLLEKHLVKID
ncbi:putative ABC transporter permease subunit [Helcococcus massiliensis]|uniref:putative ABC transporter permease subunit n=1 Tax=Helcococcus massiliensis TaxID=2040290 RepID=UPI000CDEB14E|nr:ABC transporter permease [Helcococcus massiliensis]